MWQCMLDWEHSAQSGDTGAERWDHGQTRDRIFLILCFARKTLYHEDSRRIPPLDVVGRVSTLQMGKWNVFEVCCEVSLFFETLRAILRLLPIPEHDVLTVFPAQAFLE